VLGALQVGLVSLLKVTLKLLQTVGSTHMFIT
jgi:hypothetical protein